MINAQICKYKHVATPMVRSQRPSAHSEAADGGLTLKETLSAVDGMLGAADEMLSARRGNSGGSNGVGKVVEAKTQVHPQRVGKQRGWRTHRGPQS